MRLLVLGTGPFAVPMFQSLLDSPHQVLALVTRPTPPAKDRDKEAANPMRQLAESHCVPVHAPATINSDEGKRLISELKPDLLVVCDYGEILFRHEPLRDLRTRLVELVCAMTGLAEQHVARVANQFDQRIVVLARTG